MLDKIFDSLITLETCEMNDRWSEMARFQECKRDWSLHLRYRRRGAHRAGKSHGPCHCNQNEHHPALQATLAQSGFISNHETSQLSQPQGLGASLFNEGRKARGGGGEGDVSLAPDSSPGKPV